MKKMLITGGTGFIGSNLCIRFSDKYKVTSFSDYDRVSDLFPRDKVQSICGTTLHLLDIKKQDIIIHCAGITGINKVLENPYKALESNILGDINILSLFNNMKPEHLIIFSSGEALGTNTNYKPDHIDFPLYDDRWCYGLSKLVAEYLSLSNIKVYNNPITVVRPFNIYGPGQVGGGAIRTFIQQALKDELITVHGDGSQVRSWCYIDDFVNGIELILENSNESIKKIYNIGNSQMVISILELAKLITELLNSKSQIDFVEAPFVDVEYRVPEISEITKLGFMNYTQLKDGILKTAEWFKEHI